MLASRARTKTRVDATLITQMIGLFFVLLGAIVGLYEMISHENMTPLATFYMAVAGMILLREQKRKRPR